MAECISTVETTVAGELASVAIQVCCLLGSLDDDLSDLEENVIQTQTVLHDAEKNQPKNESDKVRLKKLKSASLEAENVIDEAKTEDMIKMMHEEMGRKYKVRAFFTSHNPLMVRFKIALKIKNIGKKLDKNTAEGSRSQLTPTNIREDAAGIGSESLEMESPPEEIIGRNEEKKKIVDKICNHDDDDGVPRVYALLGMGGVGKTTLAQLVYKDEMVDRHFDLKCRVYVSDVFDKNRIIKQIIKNICGLEDEKLDNMSLGELRTQLLKTLEGKKYFIIMDDVWIEDGVEDVRNWRYLCQALRCGTKGSTVMVTTRKEITARLMTKNIPEMQHEVAVLSEDESWSLFKMFAFPGKGDLEENVKKLEPVGRQIVKKCGGLPLALKTWGTTMSTKKKEVNEWQLVRDDHMWEMEAKGVLPALRLSYHYLLPHWKRCFAYCCVFSKGERMRKDLLIELWMANEFITSSQGDLSLYKHGEKILSCLVQRSFFQVVVEEDGHTGEIYKMHDLMHDLAKYEMGDDCVVIEPGKELIRSDEVLHLSLSCEDFQFSEQNLKKLRSVRSMLVFNLRYTSNIIQISNHVYLRVLYLNRIESSTLPESICNLIHLRYLKISDSEIKVLPESIIYLQNLQTLIIEKCREFCELPKGLRYMRNLQRLDTHVSNLIHMPVGIKELTNLRRLSEFVVGKDDGARIGELGNLNLLGRKLELRRLKNVGGLRDAESANLKDKTNLKSLELWWSRNRSETNDEEVVEGLEPNSGLQELTIWDYMGTVLSPSWLVKLVNLTSIQFYYLEKCEQLPPLGKLPGLKRIYLRGMYSLKCFHEDDNATSKDEILFPNLQQLGISHCGSLVSLPNEIFKDLNQITIIGCEILSRRCEKGIGEDWHKISRIPHRNIDAPRFLRRGQ